MRTSIKLLTMLTLGVFVFYSCDKGSPTPEEPSPVVPKPSPKPNPPKPEEPKPKASKVLEKLTAEMIDQDGVLNIPNDITELASNIAKDNTRIISINAKNVEKIGDGAFANNPNLRILYFPNLKEIGAEAFASCKSLVKINIPLLEVINARAFFDCSSIDEIKIPMIKEIKEKAFSGILKNLDIYMGAKSPLISDDAFENTSKIKKLHVPKEAEGQYKDIADKYKFTYLNEHVLSKYSDIPAGTEIDGNTLKVFPRNVSVTDFVLSPDIHIIGSGAAFSRTLLKGKFSGLCVEDIKDYAFMDCSNITTLDFPALKKIGEKCFSGCSKISEVLAPNLETIGRFAFYSCSKLEKLSFPKIKKIDSNAFDACDNLNTIEMGGEPPWIGLNVFKNKKGEFLPLTIIVPEEAKDKYEAWKKENKLGSIRIAVKK